MSGNLELDILMEQIKKEYLISLPDQLEECEQAILKLESNLEADVIHSSLSNILRVIHSIKGTSGTYGLTFLSSICHKIENYIQESFDIKTTSLTQEKIDQLLQIIDLLKEYINHIDSGDEQNAKLTTRLNEIILDQSNHPVSSGPVKIYHALSFSNFEKKQIKNAFEEKPVKIFWSNNELEILNNILHHPCDGIIIPYNLTLMNGFSLAKAIRNIENISKDLKIILCTSDDKLEKINEINFLLKKDSTFIENLKSKILN